MEAAAKASSYRQLIALLGLRPAGGNYVHVRRLTEAHGVPTGHFRGHAWNKGLRTSRRPKRSLDSVLVLNSPYQSSKLKKRLFAAGLKSAHCELCGWAERSRDGRLPLELDHVNGERTDNRLENLRILCPNCHSLQETHRGRNIGRRSRVKTSGEWRNRDTRDT
jgi:hypothetical protein